MAKIQKPTELCNTFPFTEYDYVKIHQVTFCNTELGKIKKLFPFSSLSKQLSGSTTRHLKTGRKELFDMEAKIGLMLLKSRYNLSDRLLIERLNSDIHFQLFCGVIISPSDPIVNYKIFSRIRTELSKKLNINDFQKAIAIALKPHISSNDQRIVMSDASCYESYVRFPTNEKLLWESVEWLYRMMKQQSNLLSLRPIVRGKEVKNVEFGAKVNAIQIGGFNFAEHPEFQRFSRGYTSSGLCYTTQDVIQY